MQQVLRRIKNRGRSRTSTKTTSELGPSIDYSGSDAYEASEHPQCATPVLKSPVGSWSSRSPPGVKGALKVVTNISPINQPKKPPVPVASRDVSPESPNLGSHPSQSLAAPSRPKLEPRLEPSPAMPSYPKSESPATPLHVPSRNATPKKSALRRHETLPAVPEKDMLPSERDGRDMLPSERDERDLLPSEPETLEALLNQHSTQLAHLADRIEHINEWVELDGCRLDCLMKEAGERFVGKAEEDEKERRFRAQSMLPSRPSTPFQSGSRKGRAPVKTVGFGDLSPVTKEEAIDADINVRDVRDRILTAKRFRAEIAKSVHWHREESLRIKKKLGKESNEAAIDPQPRMDDWGVDRKTWEKTCGRLPTPDEWHNMLSSERFLWDENGTRTGVTQSPRDQVLKCNNAE